MSKIQQWLLDLLYPRKCVLCTGLLEKDRVYLCDKCRKDTEKVKGKIHRGSFFTHCISVYYYEKDVSSAVKRLKFGGKAHYALCFGALIAERLAEEGTTCEAVTWVPVSAARKRARGYDQAYLIAKAVAECMGLPLLKSLKKIRHNPPQAREKDSASRRANVLNAYASVNPDAIRGKKLLLVDDVITSGATLSECCRILKMAGAESLYCATFAAARE